MFARLMRRMFTARNPLQPDLDAAAECFAPVMIAMARGVDVDLHRMASGFANAMLKDGATPHQAMSAHWGGVTAIGQDPELYLNFVQSFDDAFEATVGDQGHRPAVDGKTKYVVAAHTMVSLVMADAPGEFERFLEYMSRR